MIEQSRDRPAIDPIGVECHKCGCIFFGEPTHQFCAVCIKEIAASMASAQRTITLPQPTKDQEEYLQKIQDATGKYDPNVMVGPPTKRR